MTPANCLVEPGPGLDDLAGNTDGIHTPEKQKWKQWKKKIRWSGLTSRVQDCDTDGF
jgi:hypothetical protein